MDNPDLLPVGSDPAMPMGVPALNALTKPLSNAKAPVAKYYVCTVPNASMHRTDGKRLAFLFGYLATDFLKDQEFLDRESVEGNSYIRLATPAEVHSANMRLDPRGTMEKEIREKLTPELRKEMEDTLRSEIEAQIRAELATAGAKTNKREGDKIEPGSPAASNLDGNKVAGTDTSALARARANLATNVPGATVTLIPAAPTPAPVPLMESKPSGVNAQSSADVAPAAQQSGK